MNFWRRNPARPGAAGSERVTALDDLWLTVPLNFEAIHAYRTGEAAPILLAWISTAR